MLFRNQKFIGKYIPFNEEDKLSGIFNFYNHILQDQQFKIVNATTSTGHDGSGPIILTLRNKTKDEFWWSQPPDQSVTFCFDFPVLVTSYSLENAPDVSGTKHSYPVEWIVYGSNNKIDWDEIDNQTDIAFCSEKFCSETKVFSFSIKYPDYYSCLRITNVKNSDSKQSLILSAVEFFGEIKYPINICTRIIISNKLSCFLLINIIT